MRDMDPARLRVACYVRVSTREQAEKGYSVSEQQERLKAYCLAKDWVVAQVITDPGFSGAKLERPGMQQLISLVQTKKCDAVLVWKLDRLSRSQKDTLYLIEDVFLKNGCAFVSMNENFDTSTAFGRAMFISLVRKYTRAKKLTPRMLNELVEKIEVFDAEKVNGVWEQRLRIHYNCVGTIEIPSALPLPTPDVSVNTRKGVVVNYAPCDVAI